MSTSREHYLGRLAALREVYVAVKRIKSTIEDKPADYFNGSVYERGLAAGHGNCADALVIRIKDAQYRLRRICGVPKQSDLIFGR